MNQFDYTKFWNTDFTPSFSANGFPFDLKSLMETQRKNMEALTEAQQRVLENVQEIAQKQSEMISRLVEDNTTIAQEIMTEGSPEQKVAQQADLVKAVYERSLKNYQELASMVTKSNEQTADIINKRFTASLNEMKTAVKKAA